MLRLAPTSHVTFRHAIGRRGATPLGHGGLEARRWLAVMSPLEFGLTTLGVGPSVMFPESGKGPAWLDGRPVELGRLERLAARRIREAHAAGDPRVREWHRARAIARAAARPLVLPVSRAPVPRPRAARTPRRARRACGARRAGSTVRAGPADGDPEPPSRSATAIRGAR